ncbi:ROK family protein [Sphingobacterium endophyticum]|uniref:ROK family protein n=1 Tax=Sphingobacterium endophyticum TaxID=2546448 RepID=UPI0012E2320E|nr:ROK family protein [Sphingobacterium endophyticum]
MSNRYLGIEIGGTKLQMVIGDNQGNIELRKRFVIDPIKGAIGIQEQIMDGLESWKDEMDSISAIAVGFGGPVNWKDGTIQVSHQVEGWSNFNLKDWLKEQTQKPIAIDNDANVAALGESIYGLGKGYKSVFYMTIGSGIGGGMIIDSTIYHGKFPGEVEIGHIRMNKDGETLEGKCSGWAVNQKLRSFIDQNPDSFLAELDKHNHEPEATLLKPALEAGDQEAERILFEIADDLAFALSHVVHLFHPEVLIIGGGISLLGEQLRIPIEKQLSGYLLKAFLPAPDIKIAGLAEDVVPIGALELAKTAI